MKDKGEHQKGPTPLDPEFQPVANLYNSGPRAINDKGFLISYVSLLLLSFFWGLITFVKSDKSYSEYTAMYFKTSKSCNLQTFQQALMNSNQTIDAVNSSDTTFTRLFADSLKVWVPVTAFLSLAFATGYVLLFRKYSEVMVRGTIILTIVLGYVVAIICFIVGAFAFGLIQLFGAIISTIAYFFVRGQLKLCAKLLSVSGEGLRENAALIPSILGLKVGGVATFVYLLAAFVNALYVGRPRASYDRASFLPEANSEIVTCYSADGRPVNCCVFEGKGWAAAYCFFCAITLAWTAALLMQIKLYVVADTIAQWYFSPAQGMAGSSSSSLTPALAPRRASVRLAFVNCCRSSFGSVAFAAAILAVINALRHALQRASRNNVFCCIINCIAQPFLAMAEKFTRFATIAVAITGQAFIPAARYVFDLLRKNFLETYSLWWVPDLVLGTATMLASLTWAAVVFFATHVRSNNVYKSLHVEEEVENNATGVAFATAAICWVIVFFVLQFVATLLLDIVNTVYICFAMDLDARVITRPEIHQIYTQVPSIAGAVIENPDGTVMYANPVSQPPSAAPAPVPAPAPAPVPTFSYPVEPYPYAYPAAYPPQPQPYVAYPVPPAYPTIAPQGATFAVEQGDKK